MLLSAARYSSGHIYCFWRRIRANFTAQLAHLWRKFRCQSFKRIILAPGWRACSRRSSTAPRALPSIARYGSSSYLLLSSLELGIQKSMSLRYEPSSEPLQISVSIEMLSVSMGEPARADPRQLDPRPSPQPGISFLSLHDSTIQNNSMIHNKDNSQMSDCLAAPRQLHARAPPQPGIHPGTSVHFKLSTTPHTPHPATHTPTPYLSPLHHKLQTSNPNP